MPRGLTAAATARLTDEVLAGLEDIDARLAQLTADRARLVRQLEIIGYPMHHSSRRAAHHPPSGVPHHAPSGAVGGTEGGAPGGASLAPGSFSDPSLSALDSLQKDDQNPEAAAAAARVRDGVDHGCGERAVVHEGGASGGVTPLRLASIWLGNGRDGRHVSGPERSRIAQVIPTLIAEALAQHVDPLELWRLAGERIRADYARDGQGRRPGVRVLCAQLLRWIAPDAVSTQRGRAPVSSDADFAEMPTSLDGVPTRRRGMPPVSDSFDAPDPAWLTAPSPPPASKRGPAPPSSAADFAVMERDLEASNAAG